MEVGTWGNDIKTNSGEATTDVEKQKATEVPEDETNSTTIVTTVDNTNEEATVKAATDGEEVSEFGINRTSVVPLPRKQMRKS